jgi:hypothetical protein
MTFEELVEVAHAREEIVGLYLFGSRGRKYMVDDRSDWDVCVVLHDQADIDGFRAEFPSAHGDHVDMWVTSLDQLRVAGIVGTDSEQARYAAAHVDVLVDKTGGDLTTIVESKEWIPEGERAGVVRESLDGYINLTYRSLRYGTTLDALEAIPYALRTIFALAGRIRPFNKYLEWELRNHPVEGWDADDLLSLLEGIRKGDEDAQRGLFRKVESATRAQGYGDVVDSWHPDVAWLRGETEYRASGYRAES